MERSPHIELENVTLGYFKNSQSIEVLKNLNFSFYSGELIGIVGLNGIGKTTLLKSIAGLLPILKGNIKLDHIDVIEKNLNQLSHKVSVVLTEKFGGFNLTTYDIVSTGLSPYTKAFNNLSNQQSELINKAIHQCGLENVQSKLIDELSDGFFQRALIAKALAQQTPIMLLDEPSAYLDYASKHELFILLKQLTEEEKKCILISSHDLDLLLKYCHKLLIVSEVGMELINASEAISNLTFKNITKGYL